MGLARLQRFRVVAKPIAALSCAAGILLVPAAGLAIQSGELITVEDATPTRRITGLAPGDSVNLAFTLRNVSDGPVSLRVGVEVQGADSALFDTRTGLIVEVDQCSRPWTHVPDGRTAAPTYRCEGEEVPIFGPAPLGADRNDLPLAEPGLPPGSAASYRGIATLSPEAGASFESSSLGQWRLVAVAEAGGEQHAVVISEVLGAQEGPSRAADRISWLAGLDVVEVAVALLAGLIVGGLVWPAFDGFRRRGRADGRGGRR